MIDELFLTDIAFKEDFSVSPTGDLERISGMENLKEAIFRRLVTQKGSVVHRPNYGASVRDYLNGQLSQATISRLIQDIKEQLQNEQRIESVGDVYFVSDPSNPSKIKIVMVVKPVGQMPQQLNFLPFGA